MPTSKRLAWSALVFILLLAGLFVLYLWLALHWNYSEGERAGYVQKFSKKGWLCKTWEGELALVTLPGAVPEKFEFTVRDDQVAANINKLVGTRVTLTYEQHKGLPGNCLSDTEYFVTSVKPMSAQGTYDNLIVN